MKDEWHGLNVMVSKEMVFILYYHHLQISRFNLYFCHNKNKRKKKLRGLWKQNKFVLARVWNISKTIHVFLHNRKHFQSLKDVKAKTVYTINRRLQNLQNSAFECLPAYCSGLYKVRHQCEFEIKDKTGSNTDSKLPLQPHSYLNLSNFT